MKEKSTNIFTVILGVISGLSTLLILFALFFQSDKIKVDVVNTYHHYFGETFDFTNFVPRIVMLSLILLFVFIIIKTAEPITMILYNSVVLSLLTALGQKLKEFQFQEGLIHSNSFFSIRRVISLEEKKQWLVDKLAQYSPGSEYEPSRQWLINNTVDLKYNSISELAEKLQQKVIEYSSQQEKLELIKLKNNTQRQKGVFDYVENFAGWVMDHPKTVFFIIVVCTGLYFYKQASLETKMKDLFDNQNSINDETKSFMEVSKTAIAKLDENSKSYLEKTKEFARLVWEKVQEIVKTQNDLSSNQITTQHLVKSISNTMVEKTEELQLSIENMQKSFTSKIASHVAGEFSTSNIFQKVDNFGVVASNLESKMGIIQQQISALTLSNNNMSTKILSDITQKLPDLVKTASSPVLTEQLKIQIDLATQQWCLDNVGKIVEILNKPTFESFNSRINALSQSVEILCNNVEALQQANQVSNILI